MKKVDAVNMVKTWKHFDPDMRQNLIMAIGSREIPDEAKAIAMVIGTFIKGQLEKAKKDFDFKMICDCCRSGRDMYAELNHEPVRPDCNVECEFYVYNWGY